MVNFVNYGKQNSYIYGRQNLNARYMRNAANAARAAIPLTTTTTTYVYKNKDPLESWCKGAIIGQTAALGIGLIVNNWASIQKGFSAMGHGIANGAKAVGGFCLNIWNKMFG